MVEQIKSLLLTLDDTNIGLAQQLCIGQGINFRDVVKETFDTQKHENAGRFYVWELESDLLYAKQSAYLYALW
jgi:hypothetical protein